MGFALVSRALARDLRRRRPFKYAILEPPNYPVHNEEEVRTSRHSYADLCIKWFNLLRIGSILWKSVMCREGSSHDPSKPYGDIMRNKDQ